MRLAPQTSAKPYSSSHTLKQAFGMPDDAAKHYGLDAAAAKRAGLACPPWWLPPFMANHGQVHSGNQVLAYVDVDDGKPHRDFISHQSAEQPKPADSHSHGETIGLWTSSALLCAFVFFLSVYAFNGKVPTPFILCAAGTLFPYCTQLSAHLLPLYPAPAPRAASAPST